MPKQPQGDEEGFNNTAPAGRPAAFGVVRGTVALRTVFLGIRPRPASGLTKGHKTTAGMRKTRCLT